MLKPLETPDPDINHQTAAACRTWLDVLQAAVGIVLIAASALVYSVIPQTVMLIPAIMGGALLFHSVRPFLVCRHRRVIDGHQHPTGHLLG